MKTGTLISYRQLRKVNPQAARIIPSTRRVEITPFKRRLLVFITV